MNRYSWWTVNSVESLAERHNTKSLDLNQAQKNYMTHNAPLFPVTCVKEINFSHMKTRDKHSLSISLYYFFESLTKTNVIWFWHSCSKVSIHCLRSSSVHISWLMFIRGSDGSPIDDNSLK